MGTLTPICPPHRPDQERACGWRAGVWLESGVEGGAVGVGVGEDGAVVGADVAADGAVGAAVVGGDGDGHHHSYQPSASSGFVSAVSAGEPACPSPASAPSPLPESSSSWMKTAPVRQCLHLFH